MNKCNKKNSGHSCKRSTKRRRAFKYSSELQIFPSDECNHLQYIDRNISINVIKHSDDKVQKKKNQNQ